MAKTNSKNSVNNSVNPDASNVKKPLLKGITVVFDTWKSIIEHFESDLTLDYCVITDNQTRTIDIRKVESQLTEQPTYIIGKQKGTGRNLFL